MIKYNRILLSRIFGVFFLALLVLTGSAHLGDMTGSLLFLLGSVLVGLGSVGRLWCSLYINGYKNAAVIDQGPYSMTRNPLYFFSLLGAAGVGFATETWTLGIVITAGFLLMYPYVIRHEEEFLAASFGDAFRAYCAKTPRFFPDPRLLKEPDSYTVDVKRFRKSIGDALWFIWGLGLLAVIHGLHETGAVRPLLKLP